MSRRHFKNNRIVRTLLQVENLSEGALPSTTIVELDGVLTVRGDQRANTVEITDTGTDAAGNVTVVADGETYTSTGAITEIKVFTGSGRDDVSYQLDGALQSDVVRDVLVRLGNQDDTFTASLADGVLAGGSLKMRVEGGNGQDTLTVDAANANVGAGAVLDFDLRGGNGKDTIGFDATGLIEADGQLKLRADGGNGKDNIAANITLAAGSAGSVVVDVRGGNAPDTLSLFVNSDAADSPTIDASIHGGNGHDIVTHSDGVVVVN